MTGPDRPVFADPRPDGVAQAAPPQEEDIGRGTPYGGAGRRFLAFARKLGFNGIQLRPQGQTGPGNPSPYEGTVSARNPFSIAAAPLARDPRWGGLLAEEMLAAAVGEAAGWDRDRTHYGGAFRLQQQLPGVRRKQVQPHREAVRRRKELRRDVHAGHPHSPARQLQRLLRGAASHLQQVRPGTAAQLPHHPARRGAAHPMQQGIDYQPAGRPAQPAGRGKHHLKSYGAGAGGTRNPGPGLQKNVRNILASAGTMYYIVVSEER